jgi:hypothetical protein
MVPIGLLSTYHPFLLDTNGTKGNSEHRADVRGVGPLRSAETSLSSATAYAPLENVWSPSGGKRRDS